ncbi:unnamed protein product [Vitrella brassicaformis CCMP3155]|uniref:Uncharacterized protein n=2 Tax=Vitrella brassicaformis TaxID=1169539 RepID=A0A0G4G873_VITBC|nr:unnamed protein product [Vitrella brassicaformis CCMP3155]|eukprot:CEM25086.1 unnamed protein product [Vitrella brassicaformis CCMP3155]
MDTAEPLEPGSVKKKKKKQRKQQSAAASAAQEEAQDVAEAAAAPAAGVKKTKKKKKKQKAPPGEGRDEAATEGRVRKVVRKEKVKKLRMNPYVWADTLVDVNHHPPPIQALYSRPSIFVGYKQHPSQATRPATIRGDGTLPLPRAQLPFDGDVVFIDVPSNLKIRGGRRALFEHLRPQVEDFILNHRAGRSPLYRSYDTAWMRLGGTDEENQAVKTDRPCVAVLKRAYDKNMCAEMGILELASTPYRSRPVGLRFQGVVKVEPESGLMAMQEVDRALGHYTMDKTTATMDWANAPLSRTLMSTQYLADAVGDIMARAPKSDMSYVGSIYDERQYTFGKWTKPLPLGVEEPTMTWVKGPRPKPAAAAAAAAAAVTAGEEEQEPAKRKRKAADEAAEEAGQRIQDKRKKKRKKHMESEAAAEQAAEGRQAAAAAAAAAVGEGEGEGRRQKKKKKKRHREEEEE